MSKFDRRKRKSDGPEHPLITILSRYVLNNWKNLPDRDEWMLTKGFDTEDLIDSYNAWIERYESYQHKPWVDSKFKKDVEEVEEVVLLEHKRVPLWKYHYPLNDREEVKTLSPDYLTKNNLW